MFILLSIADFSLIKDSLGAQAALNQIHLTTETDSNLVFNSNITFDLLNSSNMENTILVKSSSQSEPRSVLVVLDDSGLSFDCDCPAGERGRICKHKRALALADDSMLYDEDQRENFKQVVDWVAQSGYPDLMKELHEAENELETAKQNVWGIKEKITHAMKEGLK